MTTVVDSLVKVFDVIDGKDIKKLAVELSKNPAAQQKLRDLFTATERAAWQEEVIANTACEAGADTCGFKVIPRKDAVIEIAVKSKVRQVGKTGLTALILHSLNNAGFKNVEVRGAYTTGPDDYVLDEERLKRLAEMNGDVKIRLLDDPVFLKA